MLNKEGRYILEQVISRGGLMGAAAKMYINDESKIDEFIKECSEQCHNESAKQLWGKELVSEIQNHTKNRFVYSKKNNIFDLQSL